MPISYSEITKPAVPTYTEIEKVYLYMEKFILQNGEDFLLQDDENLVLLSMAGNIYTTIEKPT